MDLKCIYSLRRFQKTLRFVTSFHIVKDIAKTTRSGGSEFKAAIIIYFTVNAVILFNLVTIFSVH